jgi:hypothetical protein
VLTASITRADLIQKVGTSKTSVNFYETTRCHIPEDTHLIKSPHRRAQRNILVETGFRFLKFLLRQFSHCHLCRCACVCARACVRVYVSICGCGCGRFGTSMSRARCMEFRERVFNLSLNVTASVIQVPHTISSGI